METALRPFPANLNLKKMDQSELESIAPYSDEEAVELAFGERGSEKQEKENDA